MAGTSDKAISLAMTQVGYREGFSGGHYNNKEKYAAQVPGLSWANFEAWCATFVSWLLYMTGSLSGLTATAAVNNFLQQGMALGRFTRHPTKGAIVIYGRNGDTHTGILVKWNDTYIWTVEGNTNDNGSAEGNGVYYKKRLRDSSFIYGYVIPFYDEHCASADPKWNGKWLGQGPEPVATVAPVNAPRRAAAVTGSKLGDFSLSVTLAGIHSGKPNGNVKILQHLLNISGNAKAAGVANLVEDGEWGPRSKFVFAHFQHLLSDRNHLHWTASDCDGMPGTVSTKALVEWCHFYRLVK